MSQVENAAALPGGVGTVIPWVALGASVHRNASAPPDIDYQGNHSQSETYVPFFDTTFDFSAMLDGGYDREFSMQMGAQINLPQFNSSQSYPSGGAHSVFPFFGPFEKAVGVVFFPGVLEYRSAPSPWNQVLLFDIDWSVGRSVGRL